MIFPCSSRDRAAVIENYQSTAPQYRLERAVRHQARQRGLLSGTPHGCLALVGRQLGLEESFIAELGIPAHIEEAARWTGWCRWLQERNFGTILTGPNGGLSGRSRNLWIFHLNTARRFGFVPHRLRAAMCEAHQVVHTLRVPVVPFDFERALRPSPRRTRRNLRRILLARRATMIFARFTARPTTSAY